MSVHQISGTLTINTDGRGLIEAVVHPSKVVVPWSSDISDELAINPGPWHHSILDDNDGWYRRSWNEICAVTIHHTCSNSPHATARHYIKKWNGEGCGHPTIPYSVWVTETGEILLCVPLHIAPWHDHTGWANVHLSVGLAGRLHEYRPSDVQLDATAAVCVWALQTLPTIANIGIGLIKGHCDWTQTQCPGWDMREGKDWSNKPSGHWKHDLFECIKARLT